MVNVPAKHQMEKPFYQQAARTEMPAISEDPGIDLHLASGTYHILTSPITIIHPCNFHIWYTCRPIKQSAFFPTEATGHLLYILDAPSCLMTGNRE